MPPPLRSLLLAFALVAIVTACAGAAPPALPTAVGPPAPDGFETGAVGIDRPAAIARALKREAPPPPLGERAVKIALTAVGVPYRWGGSSPAGGFDCSGLVYWAYGRLGVGLPHSSYALYDLGRAVPRSQMEPGDLLFFYGLGHVGIYAGGGRMVHAPHSGRLVEVVSLRSSYGARLVGVRRIVSA
jgi:murein DD-endopeptidase